MTVPTADLSKLWFFLDRGLGSVVVPGALRARSVSRDGLRRLWLAYPPG